MIERYGREFSPINGREWSLLEIELFAFKEGFTVESGGLGKAGHMENLIREIWPWFVWEDDFGPVGIPQEQCEALCNYDAVGFTSGASSIKSDIMAKWALLNFFSDPVNTLCIVVSTSATDAKQRVWGHLCRDWRFARKQGKSVGKLIETLNMVRLTEGTDGFAVSDNSSVCLVAAGDEHRNEALKKLAGRKQKRVFLIIDEATDVSPDIVKEALYNLNANPYFHVVIAGNASSRTDSHGTALEPVDGWNSINETTHMWPIKIGTVDGIAVHFDGEDSPNMKRYLAGRPQLEFMRKAEDYLSAKTHLGEDSPQFRRQMRGFWPMKGDDANYILTDATLASHQCYDKPVWRSPPTDILGLDPAYSDGGDRFAMHHLQWGMSSHGIWTLAPKQVYIIKPKLIPGETRDDANIRECRRIATELNVTPRFIGIDASAGSPILSIVHRTWSPEILAVQFGGAASDLPISFHDKRIASDCYANATSELAYVLVEFVLAGQVRGITPSLAKELTARQFSIVVGNRVKIEKKADVKKRLGFSPDLWDSFSVGLMVLRTRMKVQAGSDSAGVQQQDWKSVARKMAIGAQTEQKRRMSFGGMPGLGRGL